MFPSFPFQVYCGLVALWLAYRLVSRAGRAALPPRGSAHIPWSTRDVAIVVFLYLALFYTCNLALHALRPAGAAPFEHITMITIGCYASVNIATVFYVFQVVFHVRGASAEDLGLSSREVIKNCGRGISAYVMYCPILILSARLVNYVLGLGSVRDLLAHPFVRWLTRVTGFRVEQQDVVTIWQKTESVPLILTLCVFAVILAPITEEIFFRGFLQQAVRRRRSEYATIAITALIFAAVHMNLRFFIPLALLGVLLSYLYERTGTLTAPLVVHAVHNAVMIGQLLIRKPVS